MKNLAILTILILAMGTCFAQKPEPIMGFAVELKPVAWYKQQAIAWKKEIDNNNQNAYAWYNYYRVTRNLSRLDTTDTRSSDEKFKEQKKIVDDMEKAVPNSFEYNLSRWMIAGNDLNYLPYLKKAAELGSDRIEIMSEMLTWGEVDRNKERKAAYAKKWYESSIASPGLLYYNYNVISGLKPNAIIITTGDNDTYPIWLLQSQGIRTDVTVLNASLLWMNEYRNAIFKELGVAKWDMEPPSLKKDSSKPVSYGGTSGEQEIKERYHKEIVKHIAGNSKNYPVYIALTVGEHFTKPIEENLYLTGLAYEYSTKTIDNIALLKRNFEQNYALDYIDKPFFHDIAEYWVKHCNGNYVVPMIKLYDHYKESGDTKQQEWIKSKIMAIVKGRPEEKEILKYFAQ
jgi:hypothetical protein